MQGGATFNTSGTMTGFTNTYVGVSDAVAGTTWNANTGSSITSAAALFLGNGAGTSGTFNMNGGTATFGNGAAASISIGAGFSGVGDGTGTLTVTGGTITAGTSGIKIGSTKTGVGVLNLNGGTLNSAGAIAVGTSTGTGTGGSGTINFNGGTLQATGTAVTVGATLVTNVGANGLTVDTNGGAVSIASNLLAVPSTTGALNKAGLGVLTLSGANTLAGAINVNAGTLTVGSVGAVPDFTKVTVASGANLAFNLPVFNSTTINAALAQATRAADSGLGLDVATANSPQTYSDNLTGFGNFVKTGAGTLVVTGSNTYTGTTTLSGGLLAVNAGSLPAGAIVFNNGGIASSDATARTFANVLTQSASGSFTFGSAATYTGDLVFTNATAINVGAAATRNLVVNANTTLNQGFTGTGFVTTKTGNGTLILNGDSSGLTAGGTFNLTGGIVRLGSSTALGSQAVVINGGGAVLLPTLQLSGGITVPNAISLAGSRNDPSTTATGPQIENFSGSNTLTGNIAITVAGGSGGVIQSDLGSQLTIQGNLTNGVANSARPYFLTGAGNGVVSGNILTNGTALTAVTKLGTGTWTLSAANTYTGTTTVNAGLLNAQRGFRNALVVNAGKAAVLANGNGSNNGTSDLATLTLAGTASAPTASFDLGDNAAVIRNGTLATVYAQTRASFENGGNFDFGGPGITSSAAAARAQIDGATAVGVVSNDNLGYTTFKGVTGLAGTANEILLKYTYLGDSDLDGDVDGGDFTAFVAGISQGTGGWEVGDTDYNNVINGGDFTGFVTGLSAYQGNGPLLLSDDQIAGLYAQLQAGTLTFAGLEAAVAPEPASLATLAALAAVGLRRRRRVAAAV